MAVGSAAEEVAVVAGAEEGVAGAKIEGTAMVVGVLNSNCCSDPIVPFDLRRRPDRNSVPNHRRLLRRVCSHDQGPRVRRHFHLEAVRQAPLHRASHLPHMLPTYGVTVRWAYRRSRQGEGEGTVSDRLDRLVRSACLLPGRKWTRSGLHGDLKPGIAARAVVALAVVEAGDMARGISLGRRGSLMVTWTIRSRRASRPRRRSLWFCNDQSDRALEPAVLVHTSRDYGQICFKRPKSGLSAALRRIAIRASCCPVD